MDRNVIFNVSGKRFESSISSIELHPDTLLGMLLRRKTDDMFEIFIDRDSKMFRWILYWYRTGILVDHTTVKVPNEVWLHELSYYGIGEQEQTTSKCLGELSPKHRKLFESEDELRQKAVSIAISSREISDKEGLHRRSIYNNILKYISENVVIGSEQTFFEFVGFAHGQTVQPYPNGYSDKVRFNPAWLKYWFHLEFVAFCTTLGFVPELIAFDIGSTIRKYKYSPASMTDIRTKHSSICIGITVKL